MPTTQSPAECHIDWSLVPQHIRTDVARTVFRSVVEYYKDPEHERDFQEWVVEYRKRRAQEGEQQK